MTKSIKISLLFVLGMITGLVLLFALIPNIGNAGVVDSSTKKSTNVDVIKVYDASGTQIGSYDTLLEACNNALDNYKVEICTPGTYTLPSILMDFTICAASNTNVVIDATAGGNICPISKGCSFDGLIFDLGQSNYHGFQHAGPIVMNNCTLKGLLFSYGDMTFDKCNFVQDLAQYHMWTYAGNITYTDCVFNGHGKYINVYNEGLPVYTIKASGCVFYNAEGEPSNKSAFNVKGTSGTNRLAFNVKLSDDNEAIGNFPTTNRLGSKIVMLDDGNSTDISIAVVSETGQANTLYPPPPEYKKIEVGVEQVQLTSVLGTDGIEWESSDPNICTVTQSGLVTRIAPGPCQITAKDPASGNVDEFNFDYPTITFDANEPIGLKGKATNVPKPRYGNPLGEQDMPSETPKLDGYVFVGSSWYTDQKCEQKFDSSQAVKENITLYAKWTRSATTPIVITLDADGSKVYEKKGVGFFSDEELTKEITEVNIPVKEGYTFEGYLLGDANKSIQFADAEGKIVCDPEIGVDMLAHAQWKQNEDPKPPAPPSPDDQGGSVKSSSASTGDYNAFAIAGLIGVIALLGISTGVLKIKKNR